MTNPIQFQLLSQEPEAIKQVLVPFFSDGQIETSWLQDMPHPGFRGKVKETFQAYLANQQRQIYLLGLGKQDQLATAYLPIVNFVRNSTGLEPELVVDLRHLPHAFIYQCVLGLCLSDYIVGVYKEDKNQTPTVEKVQILLTKVSGEQEKLLWEAQQTADAMKGICALVDAPSNLKTPQYLAQWARNSAGQHGYKVEILDHKALEKENLQALLAVGRGSENRPLLIKAVYKHPQRDSNQVDLGLVGKGVTFDTGGISLKQPANMHYMKSDMAGAAAVMGAIELIARLKMPINVVAVIPVAENSVDACSIRPGDIIDSYSGKTIEVIDTDAEGRLILADALSYINQHYQPEILVDLATLTGNCVAALGYEAAGLFTHNQQLAEAISEAGEFTGEKVWRLPLWDNYRDLMDSDIADIRNLSTKPLAGAITAAKFLEFFVADHQGWAHLDIAGMAFGDTEFSKQKSATGYGVRLLVQFATSLITTKTQ
jgi:leucyl aminopeptidase